MRLTSHRPLRRCGLPGSRRIAKAEWTKLRTLPSTWRTVVMATVISVALGAILCVSQVQQWSKMTAGQRQTFDPTACSLFGVVFVGAVLLAALGVRAVTAEYVDRDDPVHLYRHAHQAAGTGSQGWGHGGVRVPGGAADCRGQLRSRTADLRRQASRKCPSLIPACSKLWSSVPWR